MGDLINAVKQSQADLSSVCSLVNSVNPDVAHAEWQKIKDIWSAKAELCADLKETEILFGCRGAAMRCLENLRDNMLKVGSEPLSVMVDFGAVKMPAYAARLLAIDSYLAITWSIYDRLSNVLGRLMGGCEIVRNLNPAQNPKLVESFIAEKAKGYYQGFGVNELLLKLYDESIYASYFLRNSFVHDGGMMDNVPILTGTSAATCFVLSEEKAGTLNDRVAKRTGRQSSDIFKAVDLISQMKNCHNDLDEMFASLVEFVIGSFCTQVSSFGGKIGVNPTATAILG